MQTGWKSFDSFRLNRKLHFKSIQTKFSILSNISFDWSKPDVQSEFELSRNESDCFQPTWIQWNSKPSLHWFGNIFRDSSDSLELNSNSKLPPRYNLTHPEAFGCGLSIPGESIGLKFIPSQSELFRFIPISVSEPMWIIPNHSEPIWKTFCISFDEKQSKINPINSEIWIENLVSDCSDSFGLMSRN